MKLHASFLSFKTKALLHLGGLQLMAMLVLGTLAYYQSQDVLRRLAEERFLMQAEHVSRQVTDYIRGEVSALLILARLPPIGSVVRVRSMSASYDEAQGLYEMWINQLQEHFLSVAEMRPHCLDLVFVDVEGRELVHISSVGGSRRVLPTSELKDQSAQPYFLAANGLAAQQVYISPPTIEGGYALWISTPIFDADGGRAGVLTMRFAPDAIFDYVTNPLPGGESMLVDQLGRVFYHSDRDPPYGDANLRDLHPVLSEHLNSNAEQSAYAACELDGHDHDNGMLCMHSYGRIFYNPDDVVNYWAVVLDAPVDSIMAPTADLRNRFIGWGLAIISFSLLLTLFVTQRTIVRPILGLERAARRVADGELDRPVVGDDQDWSVVNDEIGRLYFSFGTMVDRLRSATDNLQEQIYARTAKLEISEARLEGQNAELERLNTYKSRLLSIVSHELKSPLASLDGFNRIINQIFLTDQFVDSLSEDQRGTILQVRQRVERMDRSILRLIRLVDELLDFSRIDQGKALEMHQAKTNIAPILRDVVANHAERAREKDFDIRCVGEFIEGDLWAVVDGDRLAQVFDNLLNNAVKFTDEGEGVEVEVHTREQELVISISDSGDGISADELEQIFELYQQAGDSDARKLGTGIGLSIARHIVHEHGGWIRAESPGVGRGSRFTFSVPSWPSSPQTLPRETNAREE